jgi:hypothetical protein
LSDRLDIELGMRSLEAFRRHVGRSQGHTNRAPPDAVQRSPARPTPPVGTAGRASPGAEPGTVCFDERARQALTLVGWSTFNRASRPNSGFVLDGRQIPSWGPGPPYAACGWMWPGGSRSHGTGRRLATSEGGGP